MQPSIGITGQRTARIASIDIFRGLTMVVMIFVNDLANVRGLPWWTYHMPGEINGMTYVDMVYPTFLFIVGMSLPIAIGARIKKGVSGVQLWAHVVLRAFSLLVLGLILANAQKGDQQLMGIAPNVWAFLALVGAVLFWNVYPRSERFGTLFQIMKFAGLLLVATMFVIFRRITREGHVAWIDTSYWEILGLIGWTYLAVCILYIPTRRWRWAPWIWFAVMLLLNILSVGHWMNWPDRLPFYFWPFNTGAFCLITFGGVIVSNLFLERREEAFSRKAVFALGFAVVTAVAAWLLTPLGVSKIRATPTWCLYCVAFGAAFFCLLYWICDVHKRTGWAWFVEPAGANTLLTYLVPDLYYFAFGGTTFLDVYSQGTPGVIRSVVFTFAMLAVAGLLTKLKVRMQL